MALRAGYKGFKTLGPGLEYDNTTGHLALKGEENPHSLENLSDVSITEPAAEDVLLYDPLDEEWINEDLSNTAAVIAKVDKSDIAPVLSEAVAPEGGLDPKDQFYLDNILYEATTTIPEGTAIVTTGAGKNCEVAPSVTGQIKALDDEKCDNSVIGTVEGANASQAYAVGEHFIRNGAFCTVTSAISANENLVGSNKFTSGDVASICADVTKTSYTNTNANITIDSERDTVIRQGNVIALRIRFTVVNNITSGEELFTGAGSFSGVQFLPIINLSAPYTVVNHAYINENGLCSINKIDAGTYEVVGSYICK